MGSFTLTKTLHYFYLKQELGIKNNLGSKFFHLLVTKYSVFDNKFQVSETKV